jgi:hypothetical protein
VAWGVFDLGSQWPVEAAHVHWDPWLPVGFWEQWFTKDRLVLRVGNQFVNQIFDFSRFKDPRVAFSGAGLTFPIAGMPLPGPGFGTAFEWWPIGGSPLYVVGTLNDVNFEIGQWTWDKAIRKGDFFYGLEFGYNWARGKGDFDHLHVNLFYADSPAVNPVPALPNEGGGGFKVSGEKQIGRVVGFGSYTYNTTKGGPFGTTLSRHTVTAGAALLQPFGFRGELGVGATWADPIDDTLRTQSGLEAYWKLLLLPSVWVTPGVQWIFNPTFNSQTDTISIYQIKARVFF